MCRGWCAVSSRSCRHCGVTFVSRRSMQPFCGVPCFSAYRLAQRGGRCSVCKAQKAANKMVVDGGKPSSICKECHAKKNTPDWRRKRAYVDRNMTDAEKLDKARDRNVRQKLLRRAAGKPPTSDELDKLFCDQAGRCVYCGVSLELRHLDHKMPVIRGGTNDLPNMHYTCPSCNLRKGTMTHEEFLVSKRKPVWRAHG